MTPKQIKDFAKFAGTVNVSYDDFKKDKFHREGKRLLKEVAKRLELVKGTYEIRNNRAGPAVSGETTLHGENIYIQLSQSCMGLNQGFYFRSCKGKKDYTGGMNNWMKWEELNDLDKACERFKKVIVSYNIKKEA